MRAKLIVVLATLTVVLLALATAILALGAESEPPGIVLRSGDQEQRGALNNNEWCPLVVSVRCTGFVRDAPVYPSEPIRTEPGAEMVFVAKTWSIPTRFAVPDYGRNSTGGSRDFAPAKRAEVAAPSEPGKYEIQADADFVQGDVSRGFSVVVAPSK